MASRQFENEPTPENQVARTRFLLDLSTEVLIEIFAYLPAADMITVQLTCRTIRDIVAGSAYLQYTLRAEINGVSDLLPPDVPYSERLELLRCHEKSWRHLQFNRFTESCHISGSPMQPSFALQVGYLIYFRFLGWGSGFEYGYTDLCSADRNEELRWVHLTIESSYDPLALTTPIFAVDHDLVISVRFCVVFNPSPE